MQFESTMLDGCFIIHPTKNEDERGWFERVYDENEFAQIGFREKFVQINHSFNHKKATLRGLHYQLPPFAEKKLIRCISGSVFDVAVDLRKNSATFLQYISVELSDENQKMILIPQGMAHGFITLQDHTALLYHHTQFYEPSSERGVLYHDPRVKISWAIEPLLVSDRDRNFSFLEKNFGGLEL